MPNLEHFSRYYWFSINHYFDNLWAMMSCYHVTATRHRGPKRRMCSSATGGATVCITGVDEVVRGGGRDVVGPDDVDVVSVACASSTRPLVTRRAWKAFEHRFDHMTKGRGRL